MDQSEYKEAFFPIVCHGRNESGFRVFSESEAVDVSVHVYRPAGLRSHLTIGPENCPFNFGAHHHKCNAATPGTFDTKARCVFALDLPYAMETRKE